MYTRLLRLRLKRKYEIVFLPRYAWRRSLPNLDADRSLRFTFYLLALSALPAAAIGAAAATRDFARVGSWPILLYQIWLVHRKTKPTTTTTTTNTANERTFQTINPPIADSERRSFNIVGDGVYAIRTRTHTRARASRARERERERAREY